MHEELKGSVANLVSTTLSCDLGPDLLHEALALGPTEGLEGGELRHPMSMDPDQIHHFFDLKPREYAAACCIPFLSGHVVDLFLKAVTKLLDYPWHSPAGSHLLGVAKMLSTCRRLVHHWLQS